MGQSNNVQKCNFEDIQQICYSKNYKQYILINTLPSNQQNCLIKNTILIEDEESYMNTILSNKNIHDVFIYIYGMNSNDNSVLKKYQQLLTLGFTNVFIYSGGMFEWLCLQDIYGEEEFPTTSHELDILKYKSCSIKKNNLLKDID